MSTGSDLNLVQSRPTNQNLGTTSVLSNQNRAPLSASTNQNRATGPPINQNRVSTASANQNRGTVGNNPNILSQLSAPTIAARFPNPFSQSQVKKRKIAMQL